MGRKLNTWCKNIMLVCGTITSVIGAIGSIAGLLVNSFQKKAVMGEIPAPAPDDAYLDSLGRGGPYNPVEEPIDWLSYMPEIFVAGVILLCIAYYFRWRIKKYAIYLQEDKSVHRAKM